MQDAVLALLAKEPLHGYQLHQRLSAALGAAGEELNPGRVYIALSRLQRARLVKSRGVEQASRPDKKVYEATAAGRERAQTWLSDLSWPRVAPVDFHLKLVAAAATRMADPLTLIDTQRRELLRQLTALQRSAEVEAPGSDGAVLLEGAGLRLQADIRWLEACERHWTKGRKQ